MKKVSILSRLKKPFIVIVLLIIGWFFLLRPKSYVLAVRKVPITSQVVSRNVSATGVVKSANEATLAFSISGKVVKINVVEGDLVKKGQQLAYLDTYSTYQNAQSLKDARDYAIRTRDLFLLHKEKQTELAGGDDEYELTLRQLNEKVDQAEASYRATMGAVSYGYIYAPFDATVVDVTKEVGEVATVSEPIVKLADFGAFIFEIEIDQEDFGLIKEGMPVEVKLNSYPDFVYKATVGKLPLFADPASKTFKVDIAVSNEQTHPLKLSMEGDAYIVLKTTGSEVPALTVDDVSYDADDKPFVWVVSNSKIQKKYIELGIEGDVYNEIKTPITETVVVPVKDNEDLKEGFTANIIN